MRGSVWILLRLGRAQSIHDGRLWVRPINLELRRRREEDSFANLQQIGVVAVIKARPSAEHSASLPPSPRHL